MEIDLGELPFDLDFHPSSNLVAAGLISGGLYLYRYAAESTPQRVLEVDAHTESCRALRFVNEGRAVVTGSPDCSILATDVETGVQIARIENSHGAAVNRIINLTESTIASGDDEGCIKVSLSSLDQCGDNNTLCPFILFSWSDSVKFTFYVETSPAVAMQWFIIQFDVWDTRQRSCCNSFSVHEEYISDMTFASDSMKLIGTSGDGTLSVCNLRSNKVQTRSEFSEDELLSVVIMKNGRKVICGTQTGTLLLYSWGFFKDCSDRFVDLCPSSVDVLLKLDEDRVITGSENGIIRLVGILPNRIIQPIAEHSEYPVERLAFSHDRKFLGSISHDRTLKLWDLDDLLQGSENTMPSQSAVSDSDNDEMDFGDSIPKSSKGDQEEKCDERPKL
ncbi:WD domain repeat-containing protein 55 [Orobanche gracilis]